MAAARPELKVIENPLGEFDGELTPENMRTLVDKVHDLAAQLAAAEDEMAGQDRTIRSLGATITKLKRNREAEARANEVWPVAERLFDIWKAATGNTSKRSQLTADRFELIEPHLRGASADEITDEPGPPRNALEDCAAAIIGRVYDHYSVKRPNGTTKHFWEWDRIFKNADEFEDSKARRPRDWRERLAKLDGGPR